MVLQVKPWTNISFHLELLGINFNIRDNKPFSFDDAKILARFLGVKTYTETINSKETVRVDTIQYPQYTVSGYTPFAAMPVLVSADADLIFHIQIYGKDFGQILVYCTNLHNSSIDIVKYSVNVLYTKLHKWY